MSYLVDEAYFQVFCYIQTRAAESFLWGKVNSKGQLWTVSPTGSRVHGSAGDLGV